MFGPRYIHLWIQNYRRSWWTHDHARQLRKRFICRRLAINLPQSVFMFASQSLFRIYVCYQFVYGFMAGTYKSPFSICFDWNASAQQRRKKGEPHQKIRTVVHKWYRVEHHLNKPQFPQRHNNHIHDATPFRTWYQPAKAAGMGFEGIKRSWIQKEALKGEDERWDGGREWEFKQML